MRQPMHLTVPFPVGGINLNFATWQQPEGTTVDCQNVRAYDPQSGRARGGQRVGLSKYGAGTQISGSNRIQDINHIVTVQTGSAAQTALNIRTVLGCAVSDGDVAKVTSAGVTGATGGTNALSATVPVIFSAGLFQTLYFCDGTNYVKWVASTNTASTWSASAGTLPDGGGGEKPRLLEMWRSRMVMSGIENDPHNWFMTAVGDAEDIDYSPDPEVVTQAVAGNNSATGKVGDVVNCMIPYNDDILIFGCDSSIWQMTGDPMESGRLDLISDSVGMSWGRPWCKDPHGVVYFFGSRGGVFRMTPGAPPVRLTSATVESEFQRVDLNLNIVRMAWSDEELGVHIFISPLDGNGGGKSYFFDARKEAFFPDVFPSDYHPAAVHVYDGDDPDDRVLLLGSEDGYLRFFNKSVADDDGSAIESHVWIGPFQIEEGRMPFVLSDIQACLGDGSDNLSYDVYGFQCAEGIHSLIACLAQEDGDELMLEDGTGCILVEDSTLISGGFSNIGGSFSASDPAVDQPRVRARAMYIKLYNTTSDETWSLENLQLKLSTIPTSNRRRA